MLVPIYYHVLFRCGTVYCTHVVLFQCSTVLICGIVCGTVASAVPCVCRQHFEWIVFEWIVLVLTKLVKSVKCHTLPSLRRDMNNKLVIH
jgi:hypothetical protein